MATVLAAQPKLTKKQRKGLAFRQKIGTKKEKRRSGSKAKPEPEDVPEAEILNDAGEDDEELLQVQAQETLGGRQNGHDARIGLGQGSSSPDRSSTNVKEKERVKVKDGKKAQPQSGEGGDVNPNVIGAEQPTKKRKRLPPTQAGSTGANLGADSGVDTDEDAPSNPKKKKKRRTSDSEPEGDENTVISGKQEPVKSEKHNKPRYILFVGNLRYTTSKEAVEAHFAHCDPPPSIRLLTPRTSSNPSSASLSTTEKQTKTKSKGCAFLEFPTHTSLQQALKLHHSTLDGRQINVELTAGGGGKSEKRLEKVKSRNRKLALEMQKKKRPQKLSADINADADVDSISPVPNYSVAQRHSSTSGSVSSPTKRRTWSIPEPGDDENTTHRSGKDKKRGAKKKGKSSRVRDLGTGVNAIPVG